ncbi:uncharacterized protein LTR77_001656 [Saxophila tyrrhenica]|uniref:Protein kinase domain-containing protein n=1 Tax=Saxophila tyrrhenica TaxID=1690608 RepID=A0AAV9PLP0_9PEZI|nr:hypothetical protein LTR77_001656 [Saxophila tyrrhenica]
MSIVALSVATEKARVYIPKDYDLYSGFPLLPKIHTRSPAFTDENGISTPVVAIEDRTADTIIFNILVAGIENVSAMFGLTQKPFGLTHKSYGIIQNRRLIAEGSNGSCYLAIRHDHLSKIRDMFADDQTEERAAAICPVLVAAKFVKESGSKDKNDLRNEIEVLRLPHLSQRWEITCLVDHHVEGNCQWLATPYAGGGTLRKLVKVCFRDLDLGTQYHIGRCIANAFAVFHFGVDPETMESYSRETMMTRHMDFHCENLLIRPDDSEFGFTVVLADFGRSNVFDPDSGLNAEDFRYTRGYDYQGFGFLLEAIFVINKIGKACKKYKHCGRKNCTNVRCPDVDPDCEECVRVCKTYGMLPKLTADEDEYLERARKFKQGAPSDDYELVALLKEFTGVAKVKQYQNGTATDKIKEYLAGQAMSDKDVLRGCELPTGVAKSSDEQPQCDQKRSADEMDAES